MGNRIGHPCELIGRPSRPAAGVHDGVPPCFSQAGPTPTPQAEADQVRPIFCKTDSEGLSELIELDEMGESVIWPHGLNAVKAKKLLQVKRDLEDHDDTDPE